MSVGLFHFLRSRKKDQNEANSESRTEENRDQNRNDEPGQMVQAQSNSNTGMVNSIIEFYQPAR